VLTRRELLIGLGSAAPVLALPGVCGAQQKAVAEVKSPFRVAVITDEIAPDFGHALEVAAREFGMGWVEVRSLWGKNVVSLDAKEIDEARRLLKRYSLRVTDIASPLFKVDWPEAPKSKFSPAQGGQFGADFSFAEQDKVLDKSIELAREFDTDRVRCFDFWRMDNPAPYRSAMDDRLRQAAATAGKAGITLLLENEPGCNTATGAEAARTLDAVRSPWLKLNWDPGNAAMAGEIPFPDGYGRLPKDRIGHMHCKDITAAVKGKESEWAPMGAGTIDWLGQFRQLERDGYRLAVSLETHWRGAGTAEESTRRSWAGMKELLEKAAGGTA
jgi:L-ribulose-5-phosphate 3-epimerase